MGKLRKQGKGYKEIEIIVTFGAGVEMCVWEKFPAFMSTGHCRCHPNVMDAVGLKQQLLEMCPTALGLALKPPVICCGMERREGSWAMLGT